MNTVEDGSRAEQDAARAILRFARSGRREDLRGLSYEVVVETLRGRENAEPEDGADSAPERSRRERIDGDELAAKLLLEADGHGLGVAAKRFNAAVEPGDEGEIEPEEVHVGRQTYLPRVKVGTTQGTALIGKHLSEEVWGGVVVAKGAADFVAAAKLVASGDAEFKEFRPAAKDHVRDILRRAVEQGIGPNDALERWDAYAAARAALLPYATALIDHPLLAIAGDAKLKSCVEALLEKYGAALEAVRDTADALRAPSNEASRRLLARALCLDIVFLVADDELAAVAAPTHPFHLYRCAVLADVLREHRAEIAAIGGQETIAPLLTDPIACAPHVVLSLYATDAITHARTFVAVGSFGALPQFAELTARRLGKFRLRSLGGIAARLLRLMPHASFGLRLTLIDPPSVPGAIEDVIDLASSFDEESVTPIHVVVERTHAPHESTDEEDEAVDALARELRDAGGSLTFEPRRSSLLEVAEALKRSPAHIAVVFDPGEGTRVRVGVAAPPPLSPLAVTRTYQYDAFDDRLDVVVAGSSPAFSAYHDMLCRTLEIPRSDFLGRRSGASQSADNLARVAENAIWTVVVDQAVEPTLGLRPARLLDWRSDAGRDVVTFTAHPEAVEGLVADAVRAAGLAADEETVKRTINQLFRLSGAAVLGLARSKPGASLADARIAKGVIGVLAAERWYSAQYPDALVISLDDTTSQRWILGVGSDNRHGDLLAVRSTTAGVVVEAIEVKAHDDEEARVTARAGRVEGKAATQVDQTLQALRTILAVEPTSLVIRARQDVLRDQLYRAVAARAYEPDQRRRLVHLLEELFSKGPTRFGGLIFRITIQAGAPSSAPSSAVPHRSPAGNDVGIVDIIEGGAYGRPRSPAPKAPSPPPATTAAVESEPPAAVEPEKPRRARSRDNAAPDGRAATRPSGGQQKAARHEPHGGAKGGGYSPPAEQGAQGAGRAKGSDVKALIGEAPSGTEVYWEPHRADAPLNNFGFHVTGDSGVGKTQLLRAIISAVTALGLPVCVFDNKNDYAPPEFSGPVGLRVYDIDEDGLPFNPLSLIGDERGLVQPIKQVHELTGILGARLRTRRPAGGSAQGRDDRGVRASGHPPEDEDRRRRRAGRAELRRGRRDPERGAEERAAPQPARAALRSRPLPRGGQGRDDLRGAPRHAHRPRSAPPPERQDPIRRSPSS